MGRGLSDRTLQRIAFAMLLLLLFVLAVGVLVPIYTDEIGWRFQLSRYVQDGWLDHNISESCGPNTSIAPPWSMVPVRLFSSGITALGFGPLAVRLAGIAFAMLGVLLARFAIRRAATDLGARAGFEALFYALMGVGLLPFLLVWSRPEQPVWLMLAGATALALAPRVASAREPLATSLGIAALAAIAFAYHLKALCSPCFPSDPRSTGTGCAGPVTADNRRFIPTRHPNGVYDGTERRTRK